jgi:hypothetical protein
MSAKVLAAAQAECARPQLEASGAVPDTVIEIENVDARMACAFGQQE